MKKLPVGMDNFENVIRQDYYYLDKTDFIRELLETHGFVNLFTRPRRFGKTLNMSMLKAFFEIGTDRSLFDGLSISREKELCEHYQGNYPVIFLSLKNIEAENFRKAYDKLAALLADECIRLSFLLESEKTEEGNRRIFRRLMDRKGDEADLQRSLIILMRMLRAYYGKQVILLIDEYDVPLEKADSRGYYDQMADFIRGFLGNALKTSPDLYFAVLTGCLRISQESVFTGLNNFKVHSVSGARYGEYFGFTDSEVVQLLQNYGLSAVYEKVKKWYDGYRFGNIDVYCPWDVINYVDDVLADPGIEPKLYWINVSSNDLVRRFIDLADGRTREEIEKLISFDPVYKKISENLTYGEVGKKIENLWSILYLTGYLTVDIRKKAMDRGYVYLKIPNREVREIFIEKIREWFSEKAEKNKNDLLELYHAFKEGNAQETENCLGKQLRSTISYYDSYEGFYHGFLLGLLIWWEDWTALSNRENGEGRSDIQLKCSDGIHGIIIEVKKAGSRKELQSSSKAALKQIKEKKYADALVDNGFMDILIYGISFYKKSCCVQVDRI